MPDGSALTYLWDGGDGEALWRMDASTGRTETLFPVADLEQAARPDEEDGMIEAPTWMGTPNRPSARSMPTTGRRRVTRC